MIGSKQSRERGRSTRRRVGTLALQCGLAGGAATALVVGLGVILRLPSIAVVLLAGLATGLAVLGVYWRRIDGPMTRARLNLRALRQERFRDLISDDQDAEDAIGELNREILETAVAVEERLGQMRESHQYRRDFLGNVSHELKTPISAIHGYAQTLLDGALDDPRVRREFVERILRNADRLNHLADDLSVIARIESGELRMVVRPVEVSGLIADVVESFEVRARNRSITLSVDAPGNLAVRADRERIRQVLSNLVDNALKYSNPGGRVEIGTRRVGPDVEIRVKDEGIGVSDEDLPRLTERFFRADRSRSRDTGGRGLGLAIVKHILGAHRTALEIESRIDVGSTFSFRLPAADTETTERRR